MAISENSAVPSYAFRVNDACRALGIRRTLLYRLAKSGELRLIKIAGRTLVPRCEIERLTSLPPVRGRAAPSQTPCRTSLPSRTCP
jgi:excisionase family DNA binding protein